MVPRNDYKKDLKIRYNTRKPSSFLKNKKH